MWIVLLGLIFILDNLDSFTYNIFQAVSALGQGAIVKRASETSLAALRDLSPTHIIISPGPGKPADHPFIFEVLNEFGHAIPLLGICLGMQAINEWCGGTTRRDPRPVHGKRSDSFHDGVGLFRDLPSPFEAARYHSLVLDSLGAELEATAWTAEGIAMGIAHRSYPTFGVQFHPESFLTPEGTKIFENFFTTPQS